MGRSNLHDIDNHKRRNHRCAHVAIHRVEYSRPQPHSARGRRGVVKLQTLGPVEGREVSWSLDSSVDN